MNLTRDMIYFLALSILILSPIIFITYIVIQFTRGLFDGGKQAIAEHNDKTEETEETDDAKTDNQ